MGTSDDAFVTELKRWRDVAGQSQKALAEAVGYDASYVSKVESGTQRPSRTFAEGADRVLQAGGALRRAHAAHVPASGRRRPPAPTRDSGAGSLVVEHDEAELAYDGTDYRPTQRRLLRNEGTEPVTRYLIRISVDRHPGDPERSNQLYRERPLTWDALDLWAEHDAGLMLWSVKGDRDAVKEVWLRFENEDGRFPLYPGESAWISYGYTVSDTQWGNWYQRAVRHPTDHLTVRLVFPADLRPAVWGMETTMTADALPLRTAIERTQVGDNEVYAWSTDDPPLHARYRLEWSFRNQPTNDGQAPSEVMAGLGIVQRGDQILAQRARTFDLPAEDEDCRRVIAELHSAMERVRGAHAFGKGMGIAAPQVGINRAVALVRTPDDELITLINPQVVEEAGGEDEQYEGCLSFFDVRGMVPSPLALHVEHQDINGQRRITIFERGVARLVRHEVDHLHGRLYTERMGPGVEPIPVSEYRSSGQRWKY